MRVRATEVAEQRQPGGVGSGLRDGQRHTEDRVGAEAGLVGRSVAIEQRLVDEALVVGVQTDHGRSELVDDGLYRFFYALAAVAAAAVAEFDGLVLAGGGTRWHRGAGGGAVVERDLDLHGRVASGVENLSRCDLLDDGH